MAVTWWRRAVWQPLGNPRRMCPATRLPRLFFHPPVSGLPLRGLLVRIIGGHLRRRYAIFTQDPQAGFINRGDDLVCLQGLPL